MSLLISKVFTYDVDAGNYIQAVEAADAQALEPATRKAINNFVIGCKQDGIWTAIKASCILAGARTLAGALVPLVGTAPTNSGLSGYNRKTGLIGNLSNSLNSNYVIPAGNQNNAHGSVWVSTAGNVNSIYFGVSDGANFGLYPSTSGLIVPTCNSISTIGIATPGIGNATGLWGVKRNASASFDYKAGVFLGSASVTSTVPSANAVRIFAGIGASTNARFAFYSIGESLDLARLDGRVTDLINAFAAAIP